MARHAAGPDIAGPETRSARDTRVVESVEVTVDRARVREELREPGLLSATVPGLRYATWQSPSSIRCELDVPGLRRRHEIRLDSTNSPNVVSWHSETRPEHQARLTLTPSSRGTRLELRLEFRDAGDVTASQDQLALLMREFLHNLKSRIGAVDGAPSRHGHDPLLHTGPRVPPDTTRHSGRVQSS